MEQKPRNLLHRELLPGSAKVATEVLGILGKNRIFIFFLLFKRSDKKGLRTMVGWLLITNVWSILNFNKQ